MPALVRSHSYIIPDLEFTLRSQFNKAAFRPHQREIIEAALDGKDVFVQAATSFGKSMCFQLPAVVDQGSQSSVHIHPSIRPSPAVFSACRDPGQLTRQPQSPSWYRPFSVL